MTAGDYRHALDAAWREYEVLFLKRAELDKRLARVHETICALTRLCGQTPTVPWGLTDACRVVLRRSNDALTPLEVRDRLRLVGFDLSRYANEQAAIHTTLKRLAEAGEAKRVTRGAGAGAYLAVRARVMVLEEALAQLPFEHGFDLRKTGRSKT
jgi:hypothetical protein